MSYVASILRHRGAFLTFTSTRPASIVTTAHKSLVPAVIPQPDGNPQTPPLARQTFRRAFPPIY